jgi:membrane-bound lytic murein transglycosylase D
VDVSYRWILPLAGLVLASCAATPPQPPQDEPAPALSAPPPERSHTATIDEHLYQPPAGDLRPVDSMDAHVHESPWERMMHSFALPDCAEHEASRSWAQWYAERPEYLARVFKRAEPWIHFIVEEIERRGLPGELALLPIVESAYDPFAYSSGRALGAWQFISSTGRQYGLTQDWWYDGRRDVYASTHAALDYLEYLNGMFEGDWLLALASYNSGEGRVSRAVRRNVKAGKPGDFWNIRLPRETRGYVPKLLGLTCMFLNAQHYGFEMPGTPADRPVVKAVDLGTQTDLVLVSQASGVPIDVLFGLNPGYNRWATSPEGPHRVVLPVENAAVLEEWVAANDAEALMRWDQVTVQNGDTLSRLAAVHNVPVSAIRAANSLDSDLIRVGQKLRLPRDDQMMVDPLYSVAAAELAELQSGLLAADRTTHTIRSGESLSVIARRYRVSVRELQAWNDISDPHRIRAGQRLTVFRSPAPQRNRPASSEYTVQSGDSLWSIARKHKVKLNDLMRWNGLDRGSVLQPGQSLRIVF